MSLAGKMETHVDMKSPASRVLEMIMRRPHHISKASGDKIQGCQLHQGEWGQVGSIIHWNYVHDGKAKVAMHLIEAVDEAKNMIIFKTIDSDLLKLYKTFRYIVQFTPKGDGSVAHCTLEYEKLHGNVPDSHTMLKLCEEVFKDIDAHLMEEGN